MITHRYVYLSHGLGWFTFYTDDAGEFLGYSVKHWRGKYWELTYVYIADPSLTGITNL